MNQDSLDSVGDALYPRGFRKTVAMLLFFLLTTMPTVILWENTPVNSPAQGPIGMQGGLGTRGFNGARNERFGPRGFGGGSAARQSTSRWSWLNIFSSFVQLVLATVGGAMSLALYYPRSGFKRFAILCGPMLGFGTMFALAAYLSARTGVYRFEIVLVSIFGAMPGLLLYLALVYWKANRLQTESLPEQLVPIEAVGPSAPVSPYQLPHQ